MATAASASSEAAAPADKKVIVVFGATGAQGGGVVDAILDDPSGQFAARAVTRDVASEKAQALAARGVEVVGGDIDDADFLARVFEGAYGAFVVTFFWHHFSPEKEKAQARAIAEAAKAADLQHVVWSTLENTLDFMSVDDPRMPTLQDAYKVPHFDGKGAANQYFIDAGVPTTFFLTSFYWDNFIHFGMGPRKNEDGTYTLALPMGDKKLPGVAASDIGRCAFGVLQNPSLIGQTVSASGEHPTGQEMAEVLSEVLGVTVNYYPMPFDDYRKLGFPGADDLGNMFQFKHDFQEQFVAARDVDKSRELYPGLLDFRGWVQAHKDEIQL